MKTKRRIRSRRCPFHRLQIEEVRSQRRKGETVASSSHHGDRFRSKERGFNHTALAFVARSELVFISHNHVVIAVENPPRKDLLSSRNRATVQIGYVKGGRNALDTLRLLVDQRERHFHSLPITLLLLAFLREQRHARHDDRVGRAAEVTRVLHVAAETEEDALAGNTLLVGKTARVVASDVGTVADVSLPLEPQRYLAATKRPYR